MNEPRVTLELLDRLVERGFTDEIFDIVHHFEGETMARHREYCLNHSGKFAPGGTNEQVQKRLRIVLDSYVAGGFTNVEVFRFLAHASAVEVPYVE